MNIMRYYAMQHKNNVCGDNINNWVKRKRWHTRREYQKFGWLVGDNLGDDDRGNTKERVFLLLEHPCNSSNVYERERSIFYCDDTVKFNLLYIL